ncbi:hypothetical protein ACJJTC_017270 [Scirpophaga incertulas]
MECDKYEIRVLLRRYWKQKFKAAVAARKICEIEGEDTVNEPTARRWFNRFNNGDLTLEDRSRSGRPPVSMAKFLRGKKFESKGDVEIAVRQFFASKPKEWFYQGLEELAKRCVKTIEYDGLCFEY